MNRSLVRRPRPDLLTTELGDELIVFDPKLERAHRLNPTAALIWPQLGVLDLEELARELYRAFDEDLATITVQLSELLDELADEHLLEPAAGDPVPSHSSTRPGCLDLGAPDAGLGSPVTATISHTSGPFTVLDRVIGFATTEPTVARYLDWQLASLRCDRAPGTTYDLVQSDDGERVDLIGDGRLLARRSDWPSLLRQVIWGLNQLVTVADHGSLTMHAAGAVVDGVGVILPAEQESGKSTLVTGLVRSGASYLSDEAVGLGTERTVLGFSKPITLDPGSWPLFRDLEPDLPAEFGSCAVSGSEWLVQPDDVRSGCIADQPVPVGLIVFPEYRPGARIEIGRLEPAETLVRLMTNTFNLAVVGQEGLDRLADLSSAVPAFTMLNGDLDEATRAVGGLATACREGITDL